MAKYSAQLSKAEKQHSEQTKAVTASTTRGDELLLVATISQDPPERYGFISENGRVIGITKDTRDTANKQWLKKGTTNPFTLPDEVKTELTNHFDVSSWAAAVDIERCESFTR